MYVLIFIPNLKIKVRLLFPEPSSMLHFFTSDSCLMTVAECLSWPWLTAHLPFLYVQQKQSSFHDQIMKSKIFRSSTSYSCSHRPRVNLTSQWPLLDIIYKHYYFTKLNCVTFVITKEFCVIMGEDMAG